ncbi:DUF2163 domain-containing protein [Microvirga sp. BT689]|uniref:DUF2163 domain-containing protein n=1 Tax=Microvirga arvi TaxID=2778731 RepID=UPI00194FC90D|nr:DUF2163 domain-containing protein [Microvirga arvi]MBM6581388.1 DUF2163 domain-containing protein [Microvirga arvi]
MRTIPENLAAHLAEGATTLCHCWKLIRRDGTAFGFTDHDRDIVLGDIVYAARSGLEAAEATRELGFAVGGGEVAGALVSAGLTEDDIASGLYDDASVETWLVNWRDGTERVLLDIGSIGEIRRADGGFVAEVRGLMHRFDEERGRLFRATCAADLGDAQCGINLASSAYSDTGTVTRTDGVLTIAASGIGFADGWCNGGQLTWLTGDSTGLSVEIKVHRAVQGTDEFDLWQRAPQAIKISDTFRVTAGCDKTHATCRKKFDNVANFRGFPHMPGNDFIIRMPQ